MIFYVIIATLIFIGIFIKKRSEQYMAFILVLLFLFIALHNSYINGTDTISYRAYFDKIKPELSFLLSSDAQFESGYTLLNILSKKLWDNYFLFQVIYSAISTILLGIIIKKTQLRAQEKFIFLFIYFTFRYFQNSMEFLRQGLATEIIWICILSFGDDKKENKIIHHAFTVPAYCFHRSAIFNFLFMPIAVAIRKVSKEKLLIITAVLSLGILFMPKGILNQFQGLAFVVGGERYAKYFMLPEADVQSINYVNYLLRWFFVLLFALQVDECEYRKSKLIFAVSCVAVVLGSINSAIFTRLLEYYMVAIYVEIALSYRVFAKRSRAVYIFGLYAMFLTLLIRNLNTVSGGSYMTYAIYPFWR